MAANKIKGPIIDPGLCRCCRSIKKCRLLNNEYEWMGQKEVYSDMIKDCFGILLSHIEDGDTDSCVCATCVVRLRDAVTFRRQVLQSEELFLQSKQQVEQDVDVEQLKDIASKLNAKLKSDPEDLPGPGVLKADDLQDAMHEDDLFYGESFADFDDIADIKSPKLSPPHSPPELPINPGESDDDDLPLILKAKKRKGEKDRGERKGKKLGKKTKVKKRKKSVEIKAEIEEPTTEMKNTTDRDLDYMAEENLLTLIEYSFVCPFKNRRNNYYCYYCKDYYPKPEDLREHTISHDTKPFQLLMGYKKLPKLDITRIDCRLCDKKIDDLTTFKFHIEKEHGKKIYHEAKEKLLTYKLTWNDLVCVTCNDVFEDFNTLNNHMTEHFSNFTCDVCGVSFLEKTRLDAHLKRHKDNEQHTCEICGKVFKSNHYKDMHVDIVHKKKAIIRCPKCDDSFMSYALKNKHLQDVHGQKRVYPCNLCDKVYNRQKTLTEHQRRNHQKVMKHQCEYCEQRFYLPSRLKEHIATHTGERNFRCEHCDKTYPRLKSLQYHLRTHTNDRRYRCHVCGQGFIQNTSLKSHLKNHHPECDIEGCYF